jgi:hypothetical protein
MTVLDERLITHQIGHGKRVVFESSIFKFQNRHLQPCGLIVWLLEVERCDLERFVARRSLFSCPKHLGQRPLIPGCILDAMN